jgi:putative component of toxin-antitoxin plasmid stabilization module
MSGNCDDKNSAGADVSELRIKNDFGYIVYYL